MAKHTSSLCSTMGIILLVSLLLNIVHASSSCNADFTLFTQPPNWPTGLNAALSVNVDDTSVLAGGWAINFTAKGFGSVPPFSVNSFWNAGSVSVINNNDNTFTYTLTNAHYNAQAPQFIGFNADTALPHPHNIICGVAINGIPCTTSSLPPSLPPSAPSSSILLSYDYYNSQSSHLPFLVLVHGITENRHSWDPIIPLLTSHYRVLAVDLRGHGQSTNTPNRADYEPESLAADVYKTVLHVTGGSETIPPLVVGHSLGGTVVTAYGHLYPVRGVVCVDQSMDLGAFQSNIKAIEPLLIGDDATFQAVIQGLFAGLYGALDSAEVARLDALRNPIQNVVVGVWALLLDLTPAQLAARVDELMKMPGGTPYLSLFGADPGADYANWLSTRVQGAVTELWPNLGHYPHLIYPSLFVQRVIDFDTFAVSNVCL